MITQFVNNLYTMTFGDVNEIFFMRVNLHKLCLFGINQLYFK